MTEACNKIAQVRRFGSPDASGLECTDVVIPCHLSTQTMRGRTPFVPGYDVIAEVDQLGDGVRNFLLGDRVTDLTVLGSNAAYRKLWSSNQILPFNSAFAARVTPDAGPGRVDGFPTAYGIPMVLMDNAAIFSQVIRRKNMLIKSRSPSRASIEPPVMYMLTTARVCRQRLEGSPVIRHNADYDVVISTPQ